MTRLTEKLTASQLVRGEQRGREWFFKAIAQWGESHNRIVEPDQRLNRPVPLSAAFESTARRILSAHFGVALVARELPGIPKRFDFVSSDGEIAGDAKYYTLVNDQSLPPAKFSTIAEYVWLLEKTTAAVKFIAFGNDQRVSEMWHAKYGHLAKDLSFLFMDETESLRVIADPKQNFASLIGR